MNCEENLQTIKDDNLEYYYGSDYETTHIDWEQESQSESSRVSTQLLATAEPSPSIQTVLENKEKGIKL
ncbi:8292_t:CDS:1, partial [Gigaspora rosea]